MASANETNAEGSINVPQWKKDLIQRRRQQNKVLNNGSNTKVCSAITINDISEIGKLEKYIDNSLVRGSTESNRVDNNAPVVTSGVMQRIACSGASCVATTTTHESSDETQAGNENQPVAGNMRLEADASLCPTSEDTPKTTIIKGHHTNMERTGEFEHFDNDNNEYGINEKEFTSEEKRKIHRGSNNTVEKEIGVCVFAEFRKGKIDENNKVGNNKLNMGNNGKIGEECESDSSEELQYGPGIVNRLKSKYLNLTLREMNKSRVSVQRFRRAASLEDLLDCDDESEKSTRKFTKKTLPPGVAAKTERYRNATRGNESIKRARSVETLMRYQSTDETSRFIGVRQEPVNDHIVLIDRTAVKIESRLNSGLVDADRPKALNKPKRVKPLLAETERPPLDLVKTTMRLFEGSVKKLKPKGEVAAKVATFKTINDTFKAQTVKKIVPKPPIQPKPFINGNSKTPGSPKKILPTSKPTAELIEKSENIEEYRNDRVVTEPIVQSVSSVVSKFQQIEKSYTPSSSPEPTLNKLKFSPVPSPEPPVIKHKICTEVGNKIPQSSVISPSSPTKDLPRQKLSPIHQAPSSPIRQLFQKPPMPEPFNKAQPSISLEKEIISKVEKLPENRRQQVPDQIKNVMPEEIKNEKEEVKVVKMKEVEVEEEEEQQDKVVAIENFEVVDGPRTISKSALDNIGKAGSTMQFNFDTESSVKKSYLPGSMQNGNSKIANGLLPIKQIESKLPISNDNAGNLETVDTKIGSIPSIPDRMKPDKSQETKPEVEISMAIGAISSLGLIKSATTSYGQANESKLIRGQKSDSLPQKQIGIIRPLVSTKIQMPQQALSTREMQKNLINRVKNIEQATKVVVSLRSAEEIQPMKRTGSSGAGGGLWDTKPWNEQNNTMVFNFSNRKDVPDYIENDGLIIRRNRDKPKAGDGGIIMLDATLDASTTDDNDWENSAGPPSPCDVAFTNDNILINGRSNLSRTPRNHKHRIQFNDLATKTFEYPSESSMMEDDSVSCVDGEPSGSGDRQQSLLIIDKSTSPTASGCTASPILGGGGLASFTPSKVDLTSEGFELGVTRSQGIPSTSQSTPILSGNKVSEQIDKDEEEESLKSAQDAAWGTEATADLLY